MKLTTDFRDYYDWAFDGHGPEFVRIATNTGPDRREQFRILRDAGFKTPPHGHYDELLDWYPRHKQWAEGYITMFVAYTDPMAHVGEGKEIWDRNRIRNLVSGRMNPDWDAADRVATTYCSALVPGPRGVSWRRLQVGRHVFWVEYTSNDDWRSNCGEGDMELLECQLDAGYHPHIRLPLFAIDFVHGAKDMYAVDFNIAPGVKGSGVEKKLDAVDAVAAIEQACRDLAS